MGNTTVLTCAGCGQRTKWAMKPNLAKQAAKFDEGWVEVKGRLYCSNACAEQAKQQQVRA